MIRHKIIKQTVEQLLAEKSITKPPVNVQAHAESKGIIVVEEHLADNSFSGFLYRSPETRPVIGVNSAHAPVRRRFTIAHELGHFLLHPRNGVHYDKELVQLRHAKPADGTEFEEIEANRFAAELLMPEKFLHADVAKMGAIHSDDDKSIKELASKYEVSTQAMMIRLDRLNLLRA